jgi:NodT family efflux transporter outer membrane factor (OMF) lipoprotein
VKFRCEYSQCRLTVTWLGKQASQCVGAKMAAVTSQPQSMSAPSRSRIALALTAAAIAAGCAVGPNFHKPAPPAHAGYATVPLPAATAAADVLGGDAQRFVEGRDVSFKWWEAFGSPRLNSLVQQAFRANPTIPAAQAALRQAQELVYAQQGYFFPTVAADYNFERQKLAGNLSGSTAPGAQGNGSNIGAYQNPSPNPPPHNVPLYYNFHTAQLTLGFVPDVFGGNRRKVESLAAQAQMQRFELEATYITLASNVVAAAIQEASTRAQIAATREIIDYNEKSLHILRDKFRFGYAMRIDVAAQEAALAQAEQLLPPLEKQFEQTRDLIRALVGKLPNQEVEETFDIAALKLPQDLPLSLPSKIIEQRPDVRAAEEQLRSANAQVGVAIAAMLPQFTITGAVGGTATEFPWLFRSGGPFWNLIGDVTQPVFAGGTLLHTKRAADQALRQAAAQYQTAVITAYENVADTLHAMLCDADALAAAVAAENAAKVTRDLMHERMQDGYADYLTDLLAQIAYSQAVLNRVPAQAARFGDTAALYQALGGGWWNRLTGPASPVAAAN